MKKILQLLIIISTGISVVFAQNPLPGGTNNEAIQLFNTTIHIGNGNVIENGFIVFKNGIITEVGKGKSATAIIKSIDLAGQQVYPGLVSMATKVGLSDVESIAAVNDHTEMGNINPNVRTLVAYNTDSDVIPTVRSNGVLISQAIPDGGIISGQSSVFQLDGWNWQDAVLKADDGIWLNWPKFLAGSLNMETFTYTYSKNEKRKDQLDELQKLINDAKVYTTNNADRNLKLEAIKGLFDGSKVLYIRAEEAKEIIDAVLTVQKWGVKKFAIYGAVHAMDCIDFLKENKVTIILKDTHDLPARVDDTVHSQYELPAKLEAAGVQTIISYGDLGWRTRNLAYLAGTAAGFGLDKEKALQMITQNPAKLMGIDQWVGSLEVGKHATLVVSKGDLLDMRLSEVTAAYIQGKAIDLNNKHKQLYNKFSKNIKNLSK